MQDFISIADIDRGKMEELFRLAADLKKDRNGRNDLAGKTVAMIFHKPSLRTRISFEVGIHELGAHPMYVTDAEIKMGQRESIYDIGKVLSRYVHGIMIRTFAHSNCTELAEAARLLGAGDVRVIPSGVDLPAVVGEEAEPPEVLYAGRLSAEKGVLDLVEAADGIPLVVAGDGPLRERVPAARGWHLLFPRSFRLR